jgi:hypothetical protein
MFKSKKEKIINLSRNLPELCMKPIMKSSSTHLHYSRNNYHKFLISQSVLDLSYESKLFLLHVFHHYDKTISHSAIDKNQSFK